MSDLQPGVGEAQKDFKSNDAMMESWPHLLSSTKSPWVLCSGFESGKAFVFKFI
jgi:hypothetical protein